MDKYTLGEVAYKNGYEKGFQDGIKHEKQVRENNNCIHQVKMSKEDIDKIPGIKTMNSVIDDIKDIRNELTKEVEDNDRK